MSAGGCFPGGTVGEDDGETGETLCHTAARIPPPVQVSVASKMLGPSHTHTPSHPLKFLSQAPHSFSAYRGHPDACITQQAVLQLACAVVEALTGDRSRHWEEMASIEKVCSPGELAALGADMHPLSLSHAHSC